MTKSRIIIDITQLVHWQGALAGIPRVIDEVAKRFTKQDNAVFVTWVKEIGSYAEVDLLITQKIRGRGIAYVRPDGTVNDPTHNAANVVAKRVVSSKKMPDPALRLLKKARSKIRKPEVALQNIRRVTPEKGDDILIIWGEWQDQNFIDFIEKSANSGANVVQVVHDLLPLLAPQYSGAGNATETMATYFKRLFPKCKLILSVSKHTKNDIEQWTKLNNIKIPQIKIIRNGDDYANSKQEVPHEEAFAKSGLSKKQDYILWVGTIEARKNLTLLYYVWKLARSRGIKLPKLVVAGRRGWWTENIYDIINLDPEIKDDFIFLHEASDEELEWLYAHCLFSIRPSIAEGWGIPIAESISKGVVVTSSNTSSMPEIAGDLISYFNPFSTDECLNAITDLLDSKKLESAKDKIKAYKPSSWDDTYNQINKYLKEIHG